MTSMLAVTFYRLLKPKLVLCYLLLNIGVFIATVFLARDLLTGSILQGQMISYISFFTKLVFLWILGIPFLFWIIYQGTGLIAEEKRKGTLLLLVSKPVSRNRIIMGKYFGLVLSALLLGMGTILLAVSILTLITSPDGKIILQILKIVPVLGIYLVFLTLFFSAISLTLSIVCQTRAKAFWGLYIAVVLIYIVLPLIKSRVYLTDLGSFSFLYYFDLSAHLSSIYIHLLAGLEKVLLSPAVQYHIYDWYSGLLPFLSEPLYGSEAPKIVLAVNPSLIVLIWLVLAGLLLATALRKFRHMDITSSKGE